MKEAETKSYPARLAHSDLSPAEEAKGCGGRAHIRAGEGHPVGSTPGAGGKKGGGGLKNLAMVAGAPFLGLLFAVAVVYSPLSLPMAAAVYATVKAFSKRRA